MLISQPTQECYRQLPPLVHGEHLLVLQPLPAPVHGAQLYLVKAVHLEEKSYFYIIVQTSHSKVEVMDKSADISRIAILCPIIAKHSESLNNRWKLFKT